MPKIRIRIDAGPSPFKQTKLLQTLCRNAHDSYVAIIERDECVSVIYEESTLNALAAERFTPVL